jgi:hypothetical protein
MFQAAKTMFTTHSLPLEADAIQQNATPLFTFPSRCALSLPPCVPHLQPLQTDDEAVEPPVCLAETE